MPTGEFAKRITYYLAPPVWRLPSVDRARTSWPHRQRATVDLGETSLMLGTYLTRRLYVGYGVGLFETLNILQIRYRLGRHWLLQTETGTASGADVLYTIER